MLCRGRQVESTNNRRILEFRSEHIEGVFPEESVAKSYKDQRIEHASCITIWIVMHMYVEPNKRRHCDYAWH